MTEITDNKENNLPVYEAPVLTVMDATQTRTGGVPDPNEFGTILIES